MSSTERITSTNIWIYDDDSYITELLKEALENRNYLVKIVTSGRELLQGLQQYNTENHSDKRLIIILDLLLANENGKEVLQQITDLRIDEKIVVFIFSGLPASQIREMVNNFSVVRKIFQKPIRLEKLYVEIENVIKE